LNEEIVECRIHPAIGVARLGNSPTDSFIGPEVPGRYHEPAGGFHDAQGRIARRSARFRIYGYNADGGVVREITAGEANITWAAYLANKKAAWYRINLPLDIPEAKGELDHSRSRGPDRNSRRNRGTAPNNSQDLIIDPGPRRISGQSVNADGGNPRFCFDNGQFLGITVPLGELRTDEEGRLLVLGGFGASGTTQPEPFNRIRDIRNNDSWYDDASDGPVTASVVIDGKPLPVKPAWVVVAPPKFAVGIRPIGSTYDLVLQVASQLDPGYVPATPSFQEHIYPLLESFGQNQWVNAGFLRDFGWQANDNPISAENMAQLGDNSEANRPLREAVLQRFRRADYTTMNQDDWPPYFGDGFDQPAKEPRQWLAVTELQYGWLEQWAAGNFTVGNWIETSEFQLDGQAKGSGPERIEDLPLQQRPRALDRAPLEECIGGSFKPGYEMPWIMRVPMLYESPFRIRHRIHLNPDRPIAPRSRAARHPLTERNYGTEMNSEIALSPNGPFAATGPGDITKWMAIPWQGDAASCTAFPSRGDPYLPTFWPAGIPNDVLTWEGYQLVMDGQLSTEARQEAFHERADWLRRLSSRFNDSLNEFNREWHEFGLVTRQPGPAGDDFPDWIHVEGPDTSK